MNSDFKTLILDLAADDYTGLWELVWGARGSNVSRTEDELISPIRHDVTDLLHLNRVALYRGTRFGGEEERLSTSEALEALSERRQWDPPARDETHVRVLTTETDTTSGSDNDEP
jgi:hypothetical protein